MPDNILKRLYGATEKRGDFNKVVELLGNMAEVESFKGTKKYNKKSSASGIFHFLVGNGGGYNKRGQKVKYGRYNASGGQATSSFQTAQNRLKNMMTSDDYAEAIESQNLTPALIDILKAKNPDELSEHQQAVLAYANLKMKGSNFGKYLEGKLNASDLYASDWVTKSDVHSKDSILKNWNNALIRGKGKNHFKYFGLSQEETPASPLMKGDPRGQIMMTSKGPVSLNPEEYPFQPADERLRTIDGELLYKKGGVLLSPTRTAVETLQDIKVRNRIV